MKMNNTLALIMIIIGISGCFSVLFGAWLAHGGQSLSPLLQQRLATAIQYQFIHTLAALLSVIMYKIVMNKAAFIAAILFIFGILFFSGSLYIRTFFDIAIITKLAPIGGLSFAFAWLFVGISGKNLFDKHLGKDSK